MFWFSRSLQMMNSGHINTITFNSDSSKVKN